MIRTAYIFIYILMLLPGLAFGTDFYALLQKADALVNFPDSDFSAEYTIVQDRPGTGQTTTVSAVFRRDSDKKYVIIKAKNVIRIH